MKKVYIYKLNNIVVKYNNIYHSTFKIKPVHVKSNTYIDFQEKRIIKKMLNLILLTNVRISKYKNIFGKGYVPNWLKNRKVKVATKDNIVDFVKEKF